uniref:Uncharacterized protein n=1 Tax=Anguilla anguilla TaxID=7936 RepID=A0A0E9S2M7_ANGAN
MHYCFNINDNILFSYKYPIL